MGMSNSSVPDRAPVAVPPLERPRRRWRPPRLLRWLTSIALIGLIGVVLKDRYAPSCAYATDHVPPGLAILICQYEYQESKLPVTGAILAGLYEQNGHIAEAKVLADSLLSTSERADALRIEGGIAYDAGDWSAAITTLGQARELHIAEHMARGLTQDDAYLARALIARGSYREALLTLDECISIAQRDHDPTLELYCRVETNFALTRVGEYELARQELEQARALMTTDRELADVEYELGELAQESTYLPHHSGYHQQAIAHYERALAFNERAQIKGRVLILQLNLTYSLAEVGRTRAAAQHLATARLIDSDHEYTAEIVGLEARIALRDKHLDEAARLCDQAYSLVKDTAEDANGDRLELATMRARIALARNDLAAVERWARLGIELAEQLRAAQSALEVRSTLLSTRRDPYELLFIALVRGHHYEDALVSLDRWQGRAMRDALVSPNISVDLRAAAQRLNTLGTGLPTINNASLAPPANRAAVLDTLRSIDLLALVVADDSVWRVASHHGEIHIDELGSLVSGDRPWNDDSPFTLQDLFERFATEPNNRAIASQLGTLLIPEQLFRNTRDTLHVLLDGQLATLPLAALRHNSKPLIAARPLVHIASLPETSCVDPAPPGRATVLADSSGDLPVARGEAAFIGDKLGTTPVIGSAATSDALFAAKGGSVLHFSGHASTNSDGGTLKLADREVSAIEIVARKLDPALVVLFACATAESSDTDGERSSSLAMAFLEAGARQVVATLTSIKDRSVLDLAGPFYAAGGARDPVRALAEVQAKLTETNNTDWANFAVFGHDVCTSTSASQ